MGGRPNPSHGGGETKMLDNVGGNYERKTTLVEGYEDENWSRIKGVIDERKTDGKMITVLAYIGV